jgi:hypothetical protein
MEERKRRGSVVGPAILIGLGVIFLLNNLGVVSWEVWAVIVRLWPVLLIALGLDLLIGRRSAWGGLLALVLILGVLAGALWLFETTAATGRGVTTEEIRQALDDADRAEVVLAPGVGSLHVEALPESANLVEGVVRLGRRERLARDFSISGGTATFALRSRGDTIGPILGVGGDYRTWDLGLAPGVPVALRVELGAGRAELDLTGLTVGDLAVETAVGRTVVTLPGEGRFEARIEGAIGAIVVVVPEGLAARVRVEGGLSASDLPDGYRRSGDVYTSPGYEGADDRVDLYVSQAIGKVTVRD